MVTKSTYLCDIITSKEIFAMPIIIKKTDRKDFTKLECPDCGERVKGIGILKESKIEGLTFKCKKCESAWTVTTK